MAFKRHPKGGGLVEDTAYVAETAYVGEHARVVGNANGATSSRRAIVIIGVNCKPDNLKKCWFLPQITPDPMIRKSLKRHSCGNHCGKESFRQ
jgi:hypothetical protein